MVGQRFVFAINGSIWLAILGLNTLAYLRLPGWVRTVGDLVVLIGLLVVFSRLGLNIRLRDAYHRPLWITWLIAAGAAAAVMGLGGHAIGWYLLAGLVAAVILLIGGALALRREQTERQ